MSLASRVLTRRSLRRRHLAGLILLGVAAVWTLAWGATLYHFNKTMTRWLETAQANGVEISYSDRSINGSPFSIHVHLDDLSVKAKKGQTFQAGEAVFYLSLWNWHDVTIKLRQGVSGQMAQTPFTADSLKFGFAVPKHVAQDHEETGFAFWIEPRTLTLKTPSPLPFGNTIAEAYLAIRIMGAVPDFFDPTSLKTWNDVGGVVEFDQVHIDWDQMTVDGSGTLALDPELQPEGAFSGRIDGLDRAIAKLVDQHYMDKKQQSLLLSSMNVLARPSGLLGQSQPIVPISIQGGSVFLGPVKLMSFPKIEW